MYIFIVYLDKWFLASNDHYCPNSNFHSTYMSQVACQDLCEQYLGCVGISYSHVDRGCYTCKDSILQTAKNDYGFYESPGNKQPAL